MIYPPFFEQVDAGSWFRVKCPCGTINWVYAGEIDLERIRCWKCHETYWIDYETYAMHREMHKGCEGEEECEGDVEDGLEQPKV